MNNSNKTIYDYQKQLQTYQYDINLLKKRVLELERIQDQIIISKSSEASTQMQGSNTDKEININSNNNAEINIQHNHILDINKNNLGDLDALYFFDKVDPRPRSSSFSKLIPRLELNNNQEVKSRVTVTISNQNKIKKDTCGILNNNSFFKNIYKK